jgi:alginate O-acetyltransferase complex protein AlgJ
MHTARRPATAASLDAPRLQRGWELALIVLFALAIGLPGLATLAGVDRELIEGENRQLAPPPAFSLDWETLRAFPDGFTRYFEDHFAFRARMVAWQSSARLKYLHVSSQSTVIRGKDDFFFYADDGAMDDYVTAAPFTPGELEVWRRALQDTQDWLEQQGITYLFVIAPDKHVIYEENMPDTIHRLHEEWRFDQVARYLAEHSTVHVLNLRRPLIEAKATERVFHRTDTHWNDRGAFVGYDAIMRRLNEMRPGLQPLPRSAFEPRTEIARGRDLAGMLGLADVLTEEDLRLVPRQPRCGHITEENIPNSNGSAARVVTECDRPGLPRAVLYRDSFATGLVPFVSEHFSRALYLWEHDVNPEIIKAERPDVVIHEWVGRHMSITLPYNAVAAMR